MVGCRFLAESEVGQYRGFHQLSAVGGGAAQILIQIIEHGRYYAQQSGSHLLGPLEDGSLVHGMNMTTAHYKSVTHNSCEDVCCVLYL